MATARRQRVRVGLRFRYHYADGNPEWEVLERDGQRTWICQVVPGEPDWAGVVKAFTSDDILRSLNMDAFWQDRFNDCDAWYAAQEPGTIVHYHNSFGQYVRCEVIRLEADHTMRTGTVYKKGDIALRPLALVGAWRQGDLPQRRRTGEIYLPYHAARIAEGNDVLKPDYKCIFEADQERYLDKHGDPRAMEAIDLTVPDMTPDEEEAARKWRLIADVRQALENHRESDPDMVIMQVNTILGAA